MNRDHRRGPIWRAWPAVVVATIAASLAGVARGPAARAVAPGTGRAGDDHRSGIAPGDEEAPRRGERGEEAQDAGREAPGRGHHPAIGLDEGRLRPEDGDPDARRGIGPGEAGAAGGGLPPAMPSGSLPGPSPAENYQYRSSGSPASPGRLRRELLVGRGPRDGTPSSSGGQAEDNFPLHARYKYNVGTGALGGGGYTHVATDDEEFTINLTNQITVDGTFFDRQNLPTTEKGFNVPFARTFLYGNITKNWKYQIGTQGFLGQFNLLDMWMAYSLRRRADDPVRQGADPAAARVLRLQPGARAGDHQLAAVPAGRQASARRDGQRQPVRRADPVLVGRQQHRHELLVRPQPQRGVQRRRDLHPVRAERHHLQVPRRRRRRLGGRRALRAEPGRTISFVNGAGEPTTNSAFITSSGVPFFTYNNNVRANGMRTRIAPHIFWYGRFSVLAEYDELQPRS